MKKIIQILILAILLVLPGISIADCIKGDCENGKGTYTFPDGSKYKGMFKNGRIEGEGVLKYANKSKYSGSFIDGSPHGQGKMKYSDGSSYKGGFMNGAASGKGTLKNDDGSSYEGMFKNNKFHGIGTFTFSDGRQYEGGFKNGQFDGMGTLTTKESSMTVKYENGKCVGEGTITLSENNKTIGGACKDGEFAYAQKVTMPKLKAIAETEEKKKDESEFGYKKFKPENFHNEPTDKDIFQPEDFHKPQQQPKDMPTVPDYSESGTQSAGKM